MTIFQILTLILSGIFMIGAIIGVYVTMRIKMAEFALEIKMIQKDLDRKEVASLLYERENKLDHEKIIDRLEKLLAKIK